MTATTPTSTAPTPIAKREVRTRRVEFDYATTPPPRHYMDGDLIMSHVVAVLSALFPEGEDFFVRTVRNYRDQITDPELKAQVSGFIGQEAMHGRAHRDFNERLAELGFPTKRIDRNVGTRLRFGERVLPASVQLAITAALEHYTATLAETLLTDPEARAQFDGGEVASLLLWHALEESEHKAVAFDVYQTVIGSNKIRVRTMNWVTFSFLLVVIIESTISVLRDPASRNPKRLVRSLAKLRHSPWINRRVAGRIRDYNRPDFHPDDHDNRQLTEEWRTRLFGDDGELVGKLRGARAS